MLLIAMAPLMPSSIAVMIIGIAAVIALRAEAESTNLRPLNMCVLATVVGVLIEAHREDHEPIR